MTVVAVVDSGTTSTRLRLWVNGTHTWSGSRQAGARDTAVDGHNEKIRSALRELLSEAEGVGGAAPQAVVASGMITSNMGLFEVPHVRAPAGPHELARSLVRRTFPEISAAPFFFVPGVKTQADDLSLDTLASGDLLRGEEAEIIGLRERLELREPATFVHLGSHHKAIDVDAEGRILGSRTAITGELFSAVSSHTILKSSVAAVDGLPLDVDAAMAGFRAVEDHGFGRALFLVRVGEQLAAQSREAMTSYLLGALAALDVPLLEHTRNGGSKDESVIVYGGSGFAELLAALLTRLGWTNVQAVAAETADDAAARGAIWLYECSEGLGSAR